jgi:hypothetical protein
MAAIASAATRKTQNLLAGQSGMAYAIGEIAQQELTPLAPLETGQIIAQCAAAEIADRTAGAPYPALYVYCAGMTNTLREKFRTFSGKAQMVLEARVTSDRIERVSRDLELYTAAAASVLDTHRGDWGDGMFYPGGYKVEFGPVKRGGKNFLQTAKLTFEVDVSL